MLSVSDYLLLYSADWSLRLCGHNALVGFDADEYVPNVTGQESMGLRTVSSRSFRRWYSSQWKARCLPGPSFLGGLLVLSHFLLQDAIEE